MAKKQLIIDGVTYDLGAESQNVEYTNEGMTGVTNAKGALDNIHGRLDAIENPSSVVSEFTEEACTIANMRITSLGTETQSSSYKSTPFLPVPLLTKMYVKTDFTFSGTLIMLFYSSNAEGAKPISVVSSGGPYGDWHELQVPGLANYFRFTLSSGSSNHISIEFLEQPSSNVVKLKVASWNVEAFDQPYGNNGITDETVEEARGRYREVFDRVNADIICFSEWSSKFKDDGSSTPQDEILCNYPYYAIGTNNSYNYNAIFSKLPIIHTRQFTYGSQTDGQLRYFKEATLRINGKYVKVVATHCDFQHNVKDETDNTPQFLELIAKYANDPYVIIGADFNVHKWDKNGIYVSGEGGDGYLNYKYFTNAGYTLMNFDYLSIPNPKDGGTVIGDHTADNIAVKGFAMGKREYVSGTYGEPNGLSDHPMVACELVML